MSNPNRFASSTSLWDLHDAPRMSRPSSFDEHQHLAFHHLQQAQFLFATLLKDYPDEVSSPVKALVKDVLGEIPLEIQSIQPYMAKLLYKMVHKAWRVNQRVCRGPFSTHATFNSVHPIKVIECINPGAPSSSPVVAQRGGAQYEEIEQLGIPGSNNFPHEGRPVTLTRRKEKSIPGRPLVDLPFVVKFTPDPGVCPEQEPVELRVKLTESSNPTRATTPNVVSVTSVDASTSSNPSTAGPSETAARRGSASTSHHSSAKADGDQETKQKSSTAHVWKNPGWHELVRKLPDLRYTLTPPPESDRASIPPDVLPGNEHLPPPRPREGRPLRRENAFSGPSHPEIFWDKSWGPKPSTSRAVTGVGQSRNKLPSLNFGNSRGKESRRLNSEVERCLTERGEDRHSSASGTPTMTMTMEVDGISDIGISGSSPEPSASISRGPSPCPSPTADARTSSNLRGTLRRGLNVAYKAFGLETR
ncbi:hypothetical protein E1B28_003161 [Marasmius oreades]|uniref:Uncharacterized protein n=1 Tax=Marasmius oreades TaxID=181124 RepID=A0A9P7RLV7_9AGAR|nr:uncharacterized protein E1B28_003161 [Marasmius oreades]KAG7085611.1 hypothetical protein E1B28_003161 [Marasmius oreades]